MTKYPKYFTRKDLAALLECSVRTITDNERRLGLTAARSSINPRMVRYRSTIVLAAFKERNIIFE